MLMKRELEYHVTPYFLTKKILNIITNDAILNHNKMIIESDGVSIDYSKFEKIIKSESNKIYLENYFKKNYNLKLNITLFINIIKERLLNFVKKYRSKKYSKDLYCCYNTSLMIVEE